ncbi:Protein phosphatase 2C [Cordyceps fumosorosea ARSEF 2679]|uniref:Protein phosphatase 2C n=1 Tax=Cordyceps fumosorosea (strain ARSEF 2679) TaxID=1081104 RepID=A0A168EDU2_CORFA|nr:Protein phosphatase 2C [Cordyceps fumosorosea ARSEF 2679]OAA73693.1 Protein phosphatase 2C [Cordyceps fumosorosea ARSEF 2679]
MSSGLPESKDDVARRLSQHAYSTSLRSIGIKRADGAQLHSNSPCEDHFNCAQPFTPWQGGTWAAVTVFDGHNGPQTAEFLQKELLAWVQTRLSKLEPESRTDKGICRAIETCFTDLDEAIIGPYVGNMRNNDVTLVEKIRAMQLAMSGSCALLVLFNPDARTLYTACTGDSRAVLGRQTSDGTWRPEALSQDQNGSNESEMARIRDEHPNEEAATRDGKVLGLAVTRAFGDVPWKASHDVLAELSQRCFTHYPMAKEKAPTPPYLTAKPVITVTKLQDGAPAILTLASDGLWDMCEDWEVVDLAVRWLEAQPKSALEEMDVKIKMAPETVWWKRRTRQEAKPDPGFDFLARWDGFDVRFTEKKTTVEDLDNVAVHLLRNACGGNHQELLTAKLAFEPPYSRNVRDDMTVQVLFF